MKKRHLTTLAAAALAAVMLPGSTLAQAEGDISLTFALNPTCEFGQGSDMAPCEPNESGDGVFISFSNPQLASGAMDGIAVLNGTYRPNVAEGTFESSGTAMFAGEVEGCGAGTLHLDYASAGVLNEDGSTSFDFDTYTVVPGGTLPLSGSYEEVGVAAPNDDGTSTGTYVASFTCEAG